MCRLCNTFEYFFSFSVEVIYLALIGLVVLRGGRFVGRFTWLVDDGSGASSRQLVDTAVKNN